MAISEISSTPKVPKTVLNCMCEVVEIIFSGSLESALSSGGVANIDLGHSLLHFYDA